MFSEIDQLSVHEDLAANLGPMIGPNLVTTEHINHYRRPGALQERGAVIFVRTVDGNMNPVIDAFLDAGVNLFYPL